MTILITLILSIFAVSACQTTETASNVPTNAAQNEIKQISVEQAKDAVGAAIHSMVGENSAMKEVANEVNERLQRVIEQI